MQIILKWMKRIAFIVVGFSALLYAGDYAAVRIPIPSSRNPYGVVTVRPYLNVKQKSGKSEYYFLDPQPQTCVNSLFPHMGYSPCWYLRRHAKQGTNI